MKQFNPREVTAILGKIRNSFSKAYEQVNPWEYRPPEQYEEEIAKYHIERAFIEVMVFLEATGLTHILEMVQKLNDEAKKDYARTSHAEDIYLVWGEKLRIYVEAIETIFGEAKSGTITTDIMQILRGAAYFINNTTFFKAPPEHEDEVHDRIEAILKCVFPDVERKPTITSPLKHFIADTGIPSIRTLIEYKFLSDSKNVGAVVDQIFADMIGYKTTEWDRLIFVIYETRRIQQEQQWIELLRKKGIESNPEIIVLAGESPDNLR